MSLSTPTTSEVSDNILGQVETSLSQTVPLLPKAVLRVLAKTLAGVYVILYRYAGWTFLQLFVSTASWRETVVNGRTIRPLVEWGRLGGVGDPVPATRAELLVDVTVEELGGTLPAGSQLLFPGTGVIYLTTSAIALDAATKQVTIRASSDPEGNGGAGAIGNLEAGDVVSFASPLAGVARDAVVSSQVTAGADGESEDAYRARVLQRFQRPPQGGAYADYRAWGEEEAGILNVYAYTGDLPGEVDVYVEATVASSGSEDGIPTSAQLDAVQDRIDMDDAGLATRRPANAAVNVLPISRVAFDVSVSGLLAPDLPAAQDAIRDALDEYMRSREPYIVGLSVPPRRDRITESAVAGVADEAARLAGATITTVELQLGGIPTIAFTLGRGEKAKLGNATYP